MEPTYITYEQACGFKDKGLDFWCKYRYSDFSGIIRLQENVSDIFPYAPEQWQVLEWLRINHGIDFNISRLPTEAVHVSKEKGKNILKDYAIWLSKQDLEPKGINQTFYGDTPQEAYSIAFDYILNNNLI
jgi:hypothetical protein